MNRPLLALLAMLAPACSPSQSRSTAVQFSGSEVALEKAIDANDAQAVASALAAGARANARGALGVTPLEYAVGTFHKRAAEALIVAGADPNLKDDEGDSAVTIAVAVYARDPALLQMVLQAGGNPNIKRPDGEPVIVRFLNDRNLDAITYFHAHGADINARVKEEPMVVTYAISEDWDVVWRLIQLGARLDTPRIREGLTFAFKGPEITLPGSPLYPAKVEVWRHLKGLGLNPTPPMGM